MQIQEAVLPSAITYKCMGVSFRSVTFPYPTFKQNRSIDVNIRGYEAILL